MTFQLASVAEERERSAEANARADRGEQQLSLARERIDQLEAEVARLSSELAGALGREAALEDRVDELLSQVHRPDKW